MNDFEMGKEAANTPAPDDGETISLMEPMLVGRSSMGAADKAVNLER